MTKPKNTSLLLIGVGTMLTSMVISGFVLGYVTDLWLGTKPLFLLLFGLLGFIGGFLKVYKYLTHPDLN